MDNMETIKNAVELTSMLTIMGVFVINFIVFILILFIDKNLYLKKIFTDVNISTIVISIFFISKLVGVFR